MNRLHVLLRGCATTFLGTVYLRVWTKCKALQIVVEGYSLPRINVWWPYIYIKLLMDSTMYLASDLCIGMQWVASTIYVRSALYFFGSKCFRFHCKTLWIESKDHWCILSYFFGLRTTLCEKEKSWSDLIKFWIHFDTFWIIVDDAPWLLESMAIMHSSTNQMQDITEKSSNCSKKPQSALMDCLCHPKAPGARAVGHS